MITKDSTLREVYEHPIGHDVLAKIFMQLGRSIKLIDNPIVGKIKLKNIEKLLGKRLGTDFFETLYILLNQESESAPIVDRPIQHKWWKEAVFYQIYPRSFKDSDNDGIGDIQGIISKLDYLESLGINALWLSPIYDSPLDDNGYDIRDYREILSDFGTMEDFDQLVSELRKKDMKIILDLVVNHTSDEHEWFQKAISDPQSQYHDYYYFVPNEGSVPNNWVSFFTDSAWKYIEETDEYALKLFSNKQMDLNWHNPQVRKEVAEIVTFWKEKGIDGFRLDVINYIAKNTLEDGNVAIGNLMEFTGIEHYYYGEKLHEYLHELNVNAFDGMFSVGETPGIGFEMSRLLTHEDRQELDTVFLFDHLETPGHVRFDNYQYDLNFLKEYYIEMNQRLTHHEWPSLFFENHDNPRMISKVTCELSFRKRVGKLLAVLLLTQRGTPFIYQGQELGLLNHDFDSIEDFRDVESIHKYQELIKEGFTDEKAMNTVLAGSRDHARVPMPWSEGFTEVTPWIQGFPKLKITDQNEKEDAHSIYHSYRKLITLRQQNKALIYGETRFFHPNKKNYFAYYREDNDSSFFVEMNLSKEKIPRYTDTSSYNRIYSNTLYFLNDLSPYEVNIYKVR